MSKTTLRSAIILLIIIISALHLQGQSSQTDRLFWLQYKGKFGLTERLTLTMDLQHRRQSFLRYSGQQVVRPGITYGMKHGVNLTVGTALFWHNINSESAIYRFEARPYTFLEWKQPLGNWQVTHRSRFELRYNKQTSGTVVLDDYNFNYRAGHKMGLSIPLNRTGKDDLKAEVYDEVLINFGKRITVNHLDQNRLYAGVRKLLKNDLSVKLGYMYIFVPTSNPGLIVHQHILVMGFSHSL